MSAQDSRIPLPCRYFHTPQGCPYGKWCKYDHYSNNPSYLNYIKQKLHQMSKPKPQKSNHNHNDHMIHIIVESVQKCVADIINKEFHSLYQEITALKSTIERQNKMMQNNKEPVSKSTFTKHVHKITKLLKQNQQAIQSKNKSNAKKVKVPKANKDDDHEWNNIFTKIRSQLKELQADKQLFKTQLTFTSPNDTQQKHATIIQLPPPPISNKVNKRARTKRKPAADPSPFDNMSQYEELFETSSATTPVTMDQISALPAPPKRKPNPTKQTKTNKTKEKQVLMHTQSNSKKTKRNHNKYHVRKKQCHRSRCKKNQNHKHNHNHTSVLSANHVNNVDTRTKMAPFEMHWMNDTDWYQIVPTDSSEDDEVNMTTDDVAKLDMLDSI